MRVKSSKELMEKLGAKNIEEMRAVPAEKIAEVQYTIQSQEVLHGSPLLITCC